MGIPRFFAYLHLFCIVCMQRVVQLYAVEQCMCNFQLYYVFCTRNLLITYCNLIFIVSMLARLSKSLTGSRLQAPKMFGRGFATTPKRYISRLALRKDRNDPGYFYPVGLVILLVGLSSPFLLFTSNNITTCESDKASRNFVADAADIVAPAVVNIVTLVDSYIASGASSGSGFIISKDGFIVTNAHVVENSADGKVLITMWDGHKRHGIVHSFDKMSDIALVRLSDVGDHDLPVATFGVSSKLRVGEFVVALGSPLQLQNTVTFGIVSATARHASELGLAKNRSDYIQTDAAINSGNSGGPLVNLDGEVIGINTMKVDGHNGISFAIPIDTASQVVKQLMINKRVVRPYVGLRMANFVADGGSGGVRNRKRADLLSISDPKVVVVEVERGSPAQRAGIQRYTRCISLPFYNFIVILRDTSARTHYFLAGTS